ncbi:MAG: gliding motility protein GldN [Ferruginibacter sp.]|nr:gliding motility protein GldN [Ferruginibacter sp.]
MKRILKVLFLVALTVGITDATFAQKRNTKKRTTARKTTAAPTNVAPTPDTVATVVAPPPPVNDSLPIRLVKKSLREDNGVDYSTLDVKDRTPLPYEHLRADDAIYRQRIWREIDTREKINHPFNYAADEDNGNQRFISILMQAIQDSAVTVFSSNDDRFTTPLTKAEVAKQISGEPIDVPIYDEFGNQTGFKTLAPEVNLDSFYRFRVKEEVIFDKESSRLFWRILGIAPVKSIITTMGLNVGDAELFWVYYPDLRPILAKYEVYNGKNYGGRMSWEELFESRMFYGRIIKSSMDNPRDQYIFQFKSLSENKMLQLFEGENIKDKIFNYEQNMWQY